MSDEQEAIARLRYKASGLAPGGVNEQHAADLRTLLESHERMRLALERIVVESEDEDYIEELHRTRAMAHIACAALEGKQ